MQVEATETRLKRALALKELIARETDPGAQTHVLTAPGKRWGVPAVLQGQMAGEVPGGGDT